VHPALRVACEELRRTHKEEAQRVANETAAIERRVRAAMGRSAARLLHTHAGVSASGADEGRATFDRTMSALDEEEAAAAAKVAVEAEAAISERVREAAEAAEARGRQLALAEAAVVREEAVRAAVSEALSTAAAKSEAAIGKVVQSMTAQLADGAPEAVKQLVAAQCEPMRRNLRQSHEAIRKLCERLGEEPPPFAVARMRSAASGAASKGSAAAPAPSSSAGGASSWFGRWLE
jgi:hypothetical protein